MRVALLAGGRSSEHDVSLASAAGVRAGLEAAGHEVLDVTVGRDGVWRDADGVEIAVVPGRGLPGVDVVFPVLHGPYGEDGTLQGLLECLGVPYVGAGVLSSALCMDKLVFKDVMGRAGVPQVAYAGVAEARWRADRDAVLGALEPLGLPLFVKPARLGSSVGISRVDRAEDLPEALAAAFAHDARAIVEAASGGIEVECSVLGGEDGEPFASQPGEILLAVGERGWYDFAAKYEPGGMELLVPARLGAAVRERVRELAVETFLRAGCDGLARVDFFVEGERVLVNELNTMPGQTPTSVYGKLLEASGIPWPEVVDRLLALALRRHAGEAAYRS